MLEDQSESKRRGPLAAIVHGQFRPVPVSKQINISPILDRREVPDPLNQAKFHQRAICTAPGTINRPAHTETDCCALRGAQPPPTAEASGGTQSIQTQSGAMRGWSQCDHERIASARCDKRAAPSPDQQGSPPRPHVNCPRIKQYDGSVDRCQYESQQRNVSRSAR